MAAGTIGRHGSHAVLHVEGDTEHVLAHVLNGIDRIALGQISLQRTAICTNVKVVAFFEDFSIN